jgi:trypsin-like peptidase
MKLTNGKITLIMHGLLALLIHATASAQQPTPQPTVPQPSAGGTKVIESSFRTIRSVSGPRVIEDRGRSAVEDPRTVFYVPADTQIVVSFTWEGPAGSHHFEGLWKNPSGKVVMISDFDYATAQPRFSAYFRMLLSENPATGVWALEARIDGETVGTHNFQIVAASRADNPVPMSRVLPPAEIYKRASVATVFIENINQKGERRSVGSGFFIGPNYLLTAFQTIDRASKVRIVTPAGQRLEAQDVAAWNRRQDWIILKVPTNEQFSLPAAPSESWAIGDRCYVLDAPSEGNRVLIETSLIGKQTVSGAGDRLNISDTLSRRALGSPLLNDKAEVIGLVGGSVIPGSAFLEDQVFSVRNLASTSRGTLAVPMSLVVAPTSADSTTTIDSLAKSGQFTPPLVGNDDVLSGTLSRKLNRKTDPPQPIEERSEFSRQDTRAALLVTWLPKQKRKGVLSLRLYDIDNHLLTESQGKKKISIIPQKLSYTFWELNLINLAPGIYRIDISLDADAVWRTFFRIVD